MSARTLRPTGKRVLVLPDVPPKQSAGGITMVEAYQRPQGQGTVIAVGGQVQDLKPGDRVAYSWINGIEVEQEDRTLRLLYVDEILGLLTQENALDRFNHIQPS